MAHSKGPWQKVNEGGTLHIRDADGNSLMSDETYYPWCPSNAEDWNLIAAAPELLETLQETLVSFGTRIDNDDWLNYMRSVIANAKGEA